MSNIILPSKQEIRKARDERSLEEFIKDAWKVSEPMNPYQYNWHVGAICEYLRAVELGQIHRLLINMPPRMLKSMIVTVMYPAWVWTTQPHKKFANMSYSADLAVEHNVKRRDIIESHWYQQNWGDKVKLKDDQNKMKDYWNTATGQMYATSVGGTLTGKGFDTMIFDDPHNPTQAESDVQRQAAINFFRGTVQSRLNNLLTGNIIVVMQRLHEMDTSGYILAADIGYEHLSLPAEAPQKTIITLPVTKKEIIREEGDLLFPDRFPKKVLQDLERNLGSYSYSGQYQQEPAPRGGGIFKEHWWRYWQPKGMNLPPVEVRVSDEETGKTKTIRIEAVEFPEEQIEEYAQSWDLAFKKGSDTDNVAGEIWAKHATDRYLIHLSMKKRSYTETREAIRQMTQAYPNARRKLVEDKANGPAIIDDLKAEITGLIPINPGSDSKEARAESVTPQIESGHVYLPHPMLYDWVDPMIKNCAKFPNVAHDDEIDAMVQMLIYWRQKRTRNVGGA